VLVEPRDRAEREKLYRRLELASRVFNPIVDEILIIAGGREQAQEIRAVLATEPRLARRADELAQLIGEGRTEFFGEPLTFAGLAIVGSNAIVLNTDRRGTSLSTIFHEVTHILAFRSGAEDEFYRRTKKIYEPFFALEAYASKIGVRVESPVLLVRTINDEYLAYFVDVNYIILRKIEPEVSVFIPTFYQRIQTYRERFRDEASKFFAKVQSSAVIAKARREVIREIERIDVLRLIDSILRNPFLPPIAHETLKPIFRRYPVEFYDEFRDVWD